MYYNENVILKNLHSEYYNNIYYYQLLTKSYNT